MTTYTAAVREKGKSRPFQYIGSDGHVHDTTHWCKPLTKAEAQLAKRLLIKGATKAGRPIECRIVMLVKQGDEE